MPILWPLKLPERGNAITQRKTLKIEHSCSFIHHTIWIYMYPFPHLAVILTMLEWVLETPKNRGFCFNNSKTRLFVSALFAELRGQSTTDSFLISPKKSLLKSSYPNKYLPNFRTQKNPGIENFKPKKSFHHARHLKSRIPPWGSYITKCTRVHTIFHKKLWQRYPDK